MDINTLLGLNQQLKAIIDEDNIDITQKQSYISNLSTALKLIPEGYSMILMYNDPNIAGISVLSYPAERFSELEISLNNTADGIVLKDYRHNNIDLTISFHNILAWYIVNGDFLDRLNLAQQFGNIESRTYEDIKKDISTYLMAQNPKFMQLLNIYSPEKYLIDIIAAIYDKIQKYIDYAYSSNDIDKAEGLLLEQLARVEYNYKPTPPYPTEIKALWTMSSDKYLNLLSQLYTSEYEKIQEGTLESPILFPPLTAIIDLSIYDSSNQLWDESDTTNLFWTGSLTGQVNLHSNPLDVSVLNDYTYAKNIVKQILNLYIQQGLDYNNDDTLSGYLSISDGTNSYQAQYTINVEKGNPTSVPNSASLTLNIPNTLDINGYTFKPQNTSLYFNNTLFKSYLHYYLLQNLIIRLHCSSSGGQPHISIEYIISQGKFTDAFPFSTLLLRKYNFPDTIEIGTIDESNSYLYAKEFKEIKETNIMFSKSVMTIPDETVDPSSLIVTTTVNDTPVDSFATTNSLALTNFIWQLKGLEDLTTATDLKTIIQIPIIYIDFNRYGSPIFTLLIPPLDIDTTVIANIQYSTHSGYIPPSEIQYKVATFNTSDITVNVYDNSENLLETLIVNFENNMPINFKVQKVKIGYSGDTDEQIRQFKDYLPADKFPYTLKRAITNKDYQLLLAQYPKIPILKSQLVLKETSVNQSLVNGMRLKSGTFTDIRARSYTLLTGIIYVIKKVTALRETKVYGENNFIKVKETIPTTLQDSEKEQIFDYLLPFMITSNYYKIENPIIRRVPLRDVTFYTENVKNFYNNLSVLQEKLILLSNIGSPLTYNILQSALSILPYNVEIEFPQSPPVLSYSNVHPNEYYYYSFFDAQGNFVAKVYPLSLKEKNKIFVLE